MNYYTKNIQNINDNKTNKGQQVITRIMINIVKMKLIAKQKIKFKINHMEMRIKIQLILLMTLNQMLVNQKYLQQMIQITTIRNRKLQTLPMITNKYKIGMVKT